MEKLIRFFAIGVKSRHDDIWPLIEHFRMSCPSPYAAPHIGIRVTVKSPGDVYP